MPTHRDRSIEHLHGFTGSIDDIPLTLGRGARYVALKSVRVNLHEIDSYCAQIGSISVHKPNQTQGRSWEPPYGRLPNSILKAELLWSKLNRFGHGENHATYALRGLRAAYHQYYLAKPRSIERSRWVGIKKVSGHRKRSSGRRIREKSIWWLFFAEYYGLV